MSSIITLHIRSTSPERTEQIAEQIGANLCGGEVIELVSDLGGGKTTFTRGLVRGIGSHDRVGSPTFTLSREYQAPNFIIAHFDFYRLSEAGIMSDELTEVMGDPGYVTVVEWGDIVHDALPEERLTIRLDQTGDETRELFLTCPTSIAYLLKGLR